jgi:hypothetical protein
MWCHVDVVRTDVSGESVASIFRVLTRSTRRHIPEGGILHSHR